MNCLGAASPNGVGRADLSDQCLQGGSPEVSQGIICFRPGGSGN